VACGILWRLQKMWKKLHKVKTQTSKTNLEILKFSNPLKPRTDRHYIFSDRFWYMEHWNRSLYVKVMAVLRTDSELEDKTVRKWENFAAVAKNWWKRWGKHMNWTLTRPNQQQDLDQNTNSTLRTLKLKYAKVMARKGCRTGKRYGTGLMGRTQEHSKLRVDVNLTVYLKLWLPLDENKGGPIFRKVLVTLDLVETRHKSIRLQNNTIQNPTIFFIFLIFYFT
jgi:hypothetical protein